jgi:hypothetical protein
MTTDPLTTPGAAARDIARDAAVRALALALEHPLPDTPPEALITLAATTVDTALTIGETPSTRLVLGNPTDEDRVARAVLATDPDHDGTPPTHQDLNAAARVIQALTQAG